MTPESAAVPVRREPARLCQRCKHPDHWHRHDDAKETQEFRCLGYDCDRPGFAAGTTETRCGCPDFVEAR